MVSLPAGKECLSSDIWRCCLLILGSSLLGPCSSFQVDAGVTTKDDSGPLWVTLPSLVLPAASFLTVEPGTEPSSQSLSPTLIGWGLHCSWLLGGPNCVLLKEGSTRGSSVLPLPFPVHLMWGFQMYTSTLYSRLRARVSHTPASGMKSRAWGLGWCSVLRWLPTSHTFK